jgi:hypothetical protein
LAQPLLPSFGITRNHRYYNPLRLPPGPIHNRIVASRGPASGKGLPRCPGYLPDMLSPITPVDRNRWVGYIPIPPRPSPNIGWIGIHDCPFGAFSGFTCVTACQVAGSPIGLHLSPKLQQEGLPTPHCLGSYRDEPTMSRAELSSAGLSK